MRSFGQTGWLCGLLALIGSTVAAQGPAGAAATQGAPAVRSASASLPAYDVSTVKPNTTESGKVDTWTRPSEFVARNVPLRVLLQEAFGIRESLISGLPPWAEKARYDINAKVVDPDMPALGKLTQAQHRAMLQALYAERFGLQWHFETKVMSVLELVPATGGSKLQASATPEENDSTRRNTSISAKGVPVSQLTDMLSVELEHPVVDKTGLRGSVDYTLQWTRSEDVGKDNGATDEAAAPALVTALGEQLGLRLQSGKDPVQTLVIDRCTPPSPN